MGESDLFSFENGLWIGQRPPFIECPVIRNTDFAADGTLDLSNVAILPIEQRLFAQKRLQEGDILIERSGGGPQQPVGRVALFERQTEHHCFGNFISRLRVRDQRSSYPDMYIFIFFTSTYPARQSICKTAPQASAISFLKPTSAP